MTKSMNENKNLITPEKAASFIPVFISAGISILLIIFFVIPKYLKSTQVNLELNELINNKDQLVKLKSQYKVINKKFDKLKGEKSKIIKLISGKSNLETLLAKLGEIGKNNDIEFISIVPKKFLTAVEESESNNIDKEVNKKLNKEDLKIDPLLVEGTKKYMIDFSFKTEFVNLLSFLRELEFQENVILISDINLSLLNQSGDKGNNDNLIDKLDVKLTMTFYGKK